MNTVIVIREYNERDRKKLIECISDLQDHEKDISSLKKPGVEVAENYLKFIRSRHAERHGKLFLVEVDGSIVGFASMWINESTEITEYPRRYVYFSDLFIKSDFRRQGLASKLIGKVKSYAISNNIKYIKVETLAKNNTVQKLLESHGFEPYEIAWDLEL